MRVSGRGHGRNTHAEDLILDDRRERQVVENLSTISPNVDRAVLSKALVVKAIYLRNLPRLVVAADQCDAVRISNLECAMTGNEIRGGQGERVQM